MKLPPRSRLLTLIGFGVLLLIVVALKLPGTLRGASYYFPVWHWPSESYSEHSARRQELTDLRRSTPIVLAAWERTPSKAGIKWEELREKLPDGLRERLPQYSPDWNAPLDWLSSHAHEAEVARAITNRWPQWSEEHGHRRAWLQYQSPELLTNRAEYLPLLSVAAQGTNSSAVFAACLLAAYRPLLPEHARLIAGAMTNQGPLLDMFVRTFYSRYLVRQIATLRPSSPFITSALQEWAASTNRELAISAALTLARIEPQQFPPETTLEPGWRQLSPPELGRFLGLLESPELRPVAAAAWSVGMYRELLAAQPMTNGAATVKTPPGQARVLAILGELDPNAQATVPALLPLLSAADPDHARASAQAFAAVAPASADLVPLILPHLTNQATAGPLLLWLCSLGTNGSEAKESVEGLATDTVRFPQQAKTNVFMLDPILARRYGLIPPNTASPRWAADTTNDAGWLKPSEARAEPPKDCPLRLLRFWPGVAGTDAPDSLGIVPARKLRGRLPDVSLATLARHCLSNLTADFQPTAAE